MTGPKNSIAAAWGASALRPVELPTGMKALVRLPDVNDLVLRDVFPADLRDLAFRYAQSGIEVEKLDTADLKRFITFTYELIARAIRYMAPADSDAWDAFRSTGESPTAEGWEPVSFSASELAEMDVDPEDLAVLGAIVGRQRTPNEVTAMSRFDRGIITSEALEQAVQAESGARVGDFATFRPRADVADGRADGEDVRAAPVGSDADRRPGRRVRGRRGGSA